MTLIPPKRYRCYGSGIPPLSEDEQPSMLLHFFDSNEGQSLKRAPKSINHLESKPNEVSDKYKLTLSYEEGLHSSDVFANRKQSDRFRRERKAILFKLYQILQKAVGGAVYL